MRFQPSSRSVTVLAVIVVWNVVSTTIHYTHNFIMAGDYPPVPIFFPNELAYRVGIVVFWPLLTVVGVRAFVRYRIGRLGGVALGLAAYALLGFTTIFHFVGGVPQIPPLFFATIFTDFLGGCSLLGFAFYVVRQTKVARPSVTS